MGRRNGQNWALAAGAAWFLLLLPVQPVAAVAQGGMEIVPGVGTSAVFIGLSEKSFLPRMPPPDEVKTYDEELESFVQLGYDPDNYIPFADGFDHVYRWFDYYTDPVFTVHVKDHVLSYITFSAYNVHEQAVDGYMLGKSIRFHDSRDRVEDIYGPADRCYFEVGNEICEYLSQGFLVLYEEDVLMVIEIFTPR